MTPAQEHETVPNKAGVRREQISLACKMRRLMAGVVISAVGAGLLFSSMLTYELTLVPFVSSPCLCTSCCSPMSRKKHGNPEKPTGFLLAVPTD